jgi:hypothetical protein
MAALRHCKTVHSICIQQRSDCCGVGIRRGSSQIAAALTNLAALQQAADIPQKAEVRLGVQDLGF